MISRTHITICFLTLAFLCISGAFAQSFIQHSTARDVAFSFYKTAESTPNYERWIKNSEPYLSTPQAKWKEVIAKEKLVLHTAFKNFKQDDDYVVIKTKARVRLINPEDPDIDPMIMSFKFKNERKGRELFFPYEYGGDHFAVIVDNLDDYKDISISPKEVSYVKSHLGNREVNVVMRLQPVSADIQNPYVIDKTNFWMLGTRVASLSLWNQAGVMVHEYIAPWYYTPTSNSVVDLKSQQEEIEHKLNIDLDPILLPIETPY